MGGFRPKPRKTDARVCLCVDYVSFLRGVFVPSGVGALAACGGFVQNDKELLHACVCVRTLYQVRLRPFLWLQLFFGTRCFQPTNNLDGLYRSLCRPFSSPPFHGTEVWCGGKGYDETHETAEVSFCGGEQQWIALHARVDTWRYL